MSHLNTFFYFIGDAEDTPIKAPIKGSLGTKQFTYLIDCKEYEPDSEKKSRLM